MIIGLFMSSSEVDVGIIFFVEPLIPKGSAKQSLGWCIFLLNVAILVVAGSSKRSDLPPKSSPQQKNILAHQRTLFR